MAVDRYSRLVVWLKVLLPLAALALLSTLFLLSRVIDPETVIPFAEKEIQDRLRDQQVTGPIYYGTTADGDEISFAAEKLITPPGTQGANAAEEVDITLTLVSGTLLTLSAMQGQFDIAGDTATLADTVVITTSTGYRVESDRLITQLSTVDVTSPGPVAATGPFGTLDAGGMTLSKRKEDANTQLVFTNGVKLIYTPETEIE